jgi:hypothetical protein
MVISRHLDELEQTLRDARSRSSLTDEELSDVRSRISSLIHNVQHSLKSEVDKLAQARQSIEHSQQIKSFSQYSTQHFGRASIASSELSYSAQIGDSITTATTMSIPNASTISSIGDWIDEWEVGKEATQVSLGRLNDLLQTLQLEQKERMSSLELTEDDLEDTISTCSSSTSSNETTLEDDFEEFLPLSRSSLPPVTLPTNKQTKAKSTKTPQEDAEDEERRDSILPGSRVLKMSPSLSKIFSSIDLIMNGVLSAISRAVRLFKNFIFGSMEIQTKMIIRTDPLFCDDLFYDEDDYFNRDRSLDYIEYPRLCQFDSSQKQVALAHLCLL